MKSKESIRPKESESSKISDPKEESMGDYEERLRQERRAISARFPGDPARGITHIVH